MHWLTQLGVGLFKAEVKDLEFSDWNIKRVLGKETRASEVQSFLLLNWAYMYLLMWWKFGEKWSFLVLQRRSGRVVYSAVPVQARSWVWALNLHQCLQTCLWVHGLKRLSCHADLYTVSRCCNRGESEDHTSEKACKKGSTLALKPRADVTRSPKQGYRWPHEKELGPPKNFNKKKNKEGSAISFKKCP